MNFEKLEKGTINEVEEKIANNWEKENILEKTINNRDGKDNWVFYDGPIYANAKPGIHHVFAKTIKDSFCKYKTMQGFRVLRKIGLDTHGLPIEVNVEKKLGFKPEDSKLLIEALPSNKDCIFTITKLLDETIYCTQNHTSFIFKFDNFGESNRP